MKFLYHAVGIELGYKEFLPNSIPTREVFAIHLYNENQNEILFKWKIMLLIEIKNTLQDTGRF